MMEQILDIVIVAWNSPALLESCLDSIQGSEIALPGKLIVIDNSDRENISSLPPNKSIIYERPPKNLGFGGGCNLGAIQGQARFILFLNPDILFHSDTLQNLIVFLSSDQLLSDIGIMGVQLRDHDGSVQKNVARFPRFSHLFPRMLGLDRVLPSIFLSHYDRKMDYQKTQIVEQVPGAFFLVRRSVFKQLGGFDERFFMYYEDVDFSYRALACGWKTLYLAEISVSHQGGGTTQTITDKRLFYSLRSRVLYFRKHGNVYQAIFVVLGILLLEFWARLIKALVQGKLQEATSTLKAYGLFINAIPGLFK